MKQHITKEQWYELDEELRILFIKAVKIEGIPDWEFITIGKMIEFLGNDLDNITLFAKSKEFEVCLFAGYSWGYEELCDALWTAVKYKLQLHITHK